MAEECRAVEVHQAGDVNAVAGQYVVAVAAVMLGNDARFVQRLRCAVVQCRRVRAVVVRHVVAAVLQRRGGVLQVGFGRLRRVGVVAAVVFQRGVAEGFEGDFLRVGRSGVLPAVSFGVFARFVCPQVEVHLLVRRFDDVAGDVFGDFFAGVGVAQRPGDFLRCPLQFDGAMRPVFRPDAVRLRMHAFFAGMRVVGGRAFEHAIAPARDFYGVYFAVAVIYFVLRPVEGEEAEDAVFVEFAEVRVEGRFVGAVAHRAGGDDFGGDRGVFVGIGDGEFHVSAVKVRVVFRPLVVRLRPAFFEATAARHPFEARPVHGRLAVVFFVGRRGAFGGRFQAGEAIFAFGVRLAVGVARLDADAVADVIGGQGVLPAGRAVNGFAVAQPLVVDLPHAVFVGEGVARVQGLSCLRHAADGHAAGRRVVRRVLRDFGRVAGRRFRVFAVVLVFGFDGDFVSGVVGGEFVGRARRVFDVRPVALPLVFDAVLRHAVFVADGGFQLAAHFSVSRDSDTARVVGLRRLWRRLAVRRFGCVGVVAAVVFQRGIAEGFEGDFLRGVGRPTSVGMQRPDVAVDLLVRRFDDVGADFFDREFFSGIGVAQAPGDFVRRPLQFGGGVRPAVRPDVFRLDADALGVGVGVVGSQPFEGVAAPARDFHRVDFAVAVVFAV